MPSDDDLESQIMADQQTYGGEAQVVQPTKKSFLDPVKERISKAQDEIKSAYEERKRRAEELKQIREEARFAREEEMRAQEEQDTYQQEYQKKDIRSRAGGIGEAISRFVSNAQTNPKGVQVRSRPNMLPTQEHETRLASINSEPPSLMPNPGQNVFFHSQSEGRMKGPANTPQMFFFTPPSTPKRGKGRKVKSFGPPSLMGPVKKGSQSFLLSPKSGRKSYSMMGSVSGKRKSKFWGV